MFLLGVIFIVSSAVIFVMAYYLYFKEAYWLISGINFSPRQTVRERYDLPGLTKHLGRMCALIGLVFLIAAGGAFLESEILFLIPLGSLFIIIPVFLFGSERYMYAGRRTQRILNIVITAFMAAVVIFVAIMLVTGARAPEIGIKDGNLVIESVYGAEIPLDSIEQIDMVDLSGRKISKLHGFNMGRHLKGRFSVEYIGGVMLYQIGEPCNSVQIKTADDIYLINLGSEAENEDLKSKILEAMGNKK